MKVAYLDPVCGISGDMFVACLLDAGLDIGVIKAGLSSMPLDGYEISCKKVVKKGLSSTQFFVKTTSKDHTHRNLPTILSLIEKSDISSRAKKSASQVFRALAEAEGEVHGVSPDEVGFHEVGAVDSIVDIVGSAIALDALGVGELLVGPLPGGRGTVQSAHGLLPVPAPATVVLLVGFETILGGVEGELVTPTGAAILRALGRPVSGRAPRMKLDAVGYGAGSRDFEDIANVTRIFIGESVDETGTVRDLDVIETTVDDTSPQIFGYLLDRALERGAFDAFLTPVVMKKSRPGVTLTILSSPELTDELIELVFKEVPTLGVRVYRGWRRELRRKVETVSTRFGEVAIKVSFAEDGVPRGIPEYESCASIAKARDLSFSQVWNEAQRSWEKSQKK